MKIPIDIQEYKARFLGGARQYLFYVNLQFPNLSNILKAGVEGALSTAKTVEDFESGARDDLLTKGAIEAGGTAVDVFLLNNSVKKFPYLVKSTSLPDSTIEEIQSHWVGQKYKMASVRSDGDWNVTFIVDNDAKILTKFWAWQKIIHNPQSNIYGKPISYMVDQDIHLLGFDTGSTICCFKLYGAWPKSIGQIQLDYQTNDLVQFDVTFSYQYHTITEREPGALATFLQRAGRSYLDLNMEAIRGKIPI
ncbi:MAG TPA: phage tail protein [Bacteroidales bacterium]|nr:phage tail protein [Bacteroidales bacterium]